MFPSTFLMRVDIWILKKHLSISESLRFEYPAYVLPLPSTFLYAGCIRDTMAAESAYQFQVHTMMRIDGGCNATEQVGTPE